VGRPQWGNEPHTLAQFARRAGISEGRARGLFAAKPSGLPEPDHTDAGGRPMWWPATIDSWCANTGRPVSDDALWLFQAEPATTAPVELRRGLVDIPGSYGTHRRFFCIVWDTAHSHVIYLLPLDGGEHYDWIAESAAELIEPRWWPTAVVVMPFLEELGLERDPIAYIYTLSSDDGSTPDATTGAGIRTVDATRPRAGGLFSGLRNLLVGPTASGAGAGASRRAAPHAEWITHLTLEEIARALGTRLPLWLAGTLSEEHITRSLAYDRTFTVPDTSTGWNVVQQRLQRALDGDLVEQHPAAWAVLAVDAMSRLRAIRAAQARLSDSGPGWYLVARPVPPAVPVELEGRLSAAALVECPSQVADELAALRTAEADLDIDDPLGEVYAEASELLSLQLGKQIQDVGESERAALTKVHEKTLITYSSAWAGPVIEAWKATLQPVADRDAAVRLRRVRRLLHPDEAPHSDATLYHDPAGRYVVVNPPRSPDAERWFAAEWPTSLEAVAGWTDKTILAADPVSNTTTLVALTPTDDGKMWVDPLPMPLSSGRDGFAYGYSGGTPTVTYRAVLRCALPLHEHQTIRIAPRMRWDITDAHTEENRPVSQLWKTIATAQGPLRLSWPQVQLWARADADAVRRTGTGVPS
jgi:hypothetical protein